jgi:glucose-1-phosphate thymidylyltransferase
MPTWGIVPAAGLGTRMQPLAFSKELLPIGGRGDGQVERPRAVSEYLLDRMLAGGATRICFVISRSKADIVHYYGGEIGAASICYAVQSSPAGLCDAIFAALPFLSADDDVLVGLPDTVWFPYDGFSLLPQKTFSFLCFPVTHPECFDAVLSSSDGRVLEVQVKSQMAQTHWIWGAFRLPVPTLWSLHDLWQSRRCQDQYLGTLVNEHIARSGEVWSVQRGERYVDVGTLHGYREAVRFLAEAPADAAKSI